MFAALNRPLVVSPRHVLVSIIVALLAFTAGSAFVAHGTASAVTFYGCLTAKGDLYSVNMTSAATCKAKDTAVSWNQTGQPGAPGRTTTTIRTSSAQVPLNDAFTVTAWCAPGEKVLGGGYDVTTSNFYLHVSSTKPVVSDDQTLQGWRIRMSNEDYVATLTVYAICASS